MRRSTEIAGLTARNAVREVVREVVRSAVREVLTPKPAKRSSKQRFLTNF